MFPHLRRVLALVILIAAFAGCDPRSIPPPRQGATAPRTYIERGYAPFRPGHDPDTAAFRTECALSHVAADDPILYPGQPGRAHTHDFFGSTETDAYTTDPTGTPSTCFGGTLNSTAYWSPVLYNASTAAVENGVLVADMVDHLSMESGAIRGFPLQTYYKSGYHGVIGPMITRWFPQGLRIITGNMHTTTAQSTQVMYWSCANSARVDDIYNGINHRTEIPPDCPAGKVLQMSTTFPNCWDGVNLDSPSHGVDPGHPRGGGGTGHMAYPLGWPDLGCASTHPIPLPEIMQHVRWIVPPGGTAGLLLSSDVGGQRPGWSGHNDWWNGWDPEVGQSIIDTCFGPNTHDCQMNLVGPNGGDGYVALDGPPVPPVGLEPTPP